MWFFCRQRLSRKFIIEFKDKLKNILLNIEDEDSTWIDNKSLDAKRLKKLIKIVKTHEQREQEKLERKYRKLKEKIFTGSAISMLEA
jgi:hypothetical protein